MFSSSKEVSIIPFHWTHPFHMDLREFEKAYFKNVSDYPERLKGVRDGAALLHRFA